jgi:NADH dehydrogenase
MKNILLIGGTGFLGSVIIGELARRAEYVGTSITVPTRRPERARHLLVIPSVKLIGADVHDPATLAGLMQGQDAVISLVGVLRSAEGQPYGKDFARAHVELPEKIAAAAVNAGVRRVIHVSALQANTDAPSAYLRSKAAGEAVLRAADIDLTIFCPSVIFGRGDSFLTLFAGLAKILPFFPLASPNARFAPVWVNDVADCIVDSLHRAECIGKSYKLCGSQQYSLRELVQYAASVAGHPRVVIGLPDPIAWLQAWVMEFLPESPMTRDNLRSMRVASVCPDGSVLPFGRKATSLEAIAPGYLAA